VAIAEFSLTRVQKGRPINHEFVNLIVEFADISPAVTGKSDEGAESRDRARSIEHWLAPRVRIRGGRKKVKWDHGGKFEGRLDDVTIGLYGPTAFDSRRAERRDD